MPIFWFFKAHPQATSPFCVVISCIKLVFAALLFPFFFLILTSMLSFFSRVGIHFLYQDASTFCIGLNSPRLWLVLILKPTKPCKIVWEKDREKRWRNFCFFSLIESTSICLDVEDIHELHWSSQIHMHY